ncbi:hypothetical protein [Amycolatopsis rhizosphaerae]|nr:hypothetical protein [Amycolatopsis rhizosphaerae]
MDYEYAMSMLALITVILLFSTTAGGRKQQRAERKLDELNRKLDTVMAHLGVSLPEPQFPEIEELLRQGKKIEAIKVYRERTGADLREAKDAVDRMSGAH